MFLFPVVGFSLGIIWLLFLYFLVGVFLNLKLTCLVAHLTFCDIMFFFLSHELNKICVAFGTIKNVCVIWIMFNKGTYTHFEQDHLYNYACMKKVQIGRNNPNNECKHTFVNTLVYIIPFNNFHFHHEVILCISSQYVVCGATLMATATAQKFYSHAKYGDHNYDNRVDCQWRIQAKSGFRIRLRFQAFQVEDETDCG